MKKFVVYILTGIFLCLSILIPIENPATESIRAVKLASYYPSIRQFLERSNLELQNSINKSNENTPTIHIVMGNESADVDSIVSSISRAYFLQQFKGDKKHLYLPLINIPKKDLDLRGETLYLFSLLHIDHNTLLFLDDIPRLDKLWKKNTLRLDLVDHNAMAPHQSKFEPLVESIVDHHVDENINYPLLQKQDKVIRTTGSAATLVATIIHKSSKPSLLTPQIALALLAPILLDTANLKNETKTTELDIEMVKILSSIAKESIPKNYYEQLVNKLLDTSGFTPLMLLTKDFKKYKEGDLLYGISSLPPKVIWEPEQEKTFTLPIKEFVELKKIPLLMIIVPAGGNEYSKEKGLIVFSPSKELLHEVTTHISKDTELSKHLTLVHKNGDNSIYYYQMSIKMARKYLQPLLNLQNIERVE